MDFQKITSLQTDASLLGGAGYYSGDFFYTNWAIDLPAVQNEHINIKETAAVILSICPSLGTLVEKQNCHCANGQYDNKMHFE